MPVCTLPDRDVTNLAYTGLLFINLSLPLTTPPGTRLFTGEHLSLSPSMQVLIKNEPKERALCVRLATAIVTLETQPDERVRDLNQMIRNARAAGVAVNVVRDVPNVLVLRAASNSVCMSTALSNIHRAVAPGAAFDMTHCAAFEHDSIVMRCPCRAAHVVQPPCGRGVTAAHVLRELERAESYGRALCVVCEVCKEAARA